MAGIVAVDILGFPVMSNHLHLLLRIRPDVAAKWSDEEVARCWWRLHPGWAALTTLLVHHGFVEVQDYPGHRGIGGQFAGVDRTSDARFADGQ